ncbi:MAG: O-acetyl-ADP-ribose deacetylase [Desulfurococcales archaeon ex4484_217_2]|nr:MAG: O-acetyl-ADP-ribose deacetylase [Desulfurococcales archaeon ex4484_217_2]
MGNLEIKLVVGDITEMNVEAIVNPANTLMIMGGGVAKAIKIKGGTEIEREAKSRAPVPIGEAISTSAGKLKAKYVIHAPTVLYPGFKSSVKNVKKAVIAALNEAERLGVREIAFPSMGTGVGGLKYSEAAEIKEYSKKLRSVRRIFIVLRNREAYNEFVNALKSMIE